MTATAPSYPTPKALFNPDFQACVSDISLTRGDRLLISGLTLTIKAGQILYVTGENGIGKTSLLLALAGLLKPAAGYIEFSHDNTAFEQVSLMSQPDGISRGLSAKEDLMFHLRLHNQSSESDVLLESTGLKSAVNVRTENLSLGQRKRLSLAKIIAARRQVWLLDEPFSALDESGRAFVSQTIESHIQNNGICVIATHDPVSFESLPTQTLHMTRPAI